MTASARQQRPALKIVSAEPVSGHLLSTANATAVGDGSASADGRFFLPGNFGELRLDWASDADVLSTVTIGDYGFSFTASQVSSSFPIVLPLIRVAIARADDPRGYVELAHSVAGTASTLDAIAAEPDHSYDAAAESGRRMRGPIWLGLSRDMRIFSHSLHGVGAGTAAERVWDWMAPQFHGEPARLADAGDEQVRYQYMIGRGIGPRENSRRRLRGGRLPILDAEIEDGGIHYSATSFVSLESSSLSGGGNHGTDYLIADGHSPGHMFTDEQAQQFAERMQRYHPTEQTVFYSKIVATNTSSTPRYAYLTLPVPFAADGIHPVPHAFAAGFGAFGDDRTYLVALRDGGPLAARETAALLQPNESAEFELRIPHAAISRERAAALADRDFERIEADVESYWSGKLAASATLAVPETRVAEMIDAGLLHLDLVAYGSEPDGTLAPTIGAYAPIGSESAPIIQAFDSLGRPDLAERAIQYFIDKQHDDGFVQNYSGYMLETGAFLWTVGEHYRYTADTAWAERTMPSIELAVGYILRDREERSLSHGPFGLIVGKTADPEDEFASFMLNGYAYLGLSRAADVASVVAPSKAREWRAQADAFRADIRAAFFDSVARSAVAPLADGTWARTAPPWPETAGPVALEQADVERFTHGSITLRDTLLGPLWLVLQEVLDDHEPVVGEMLAYQADLFFDENTAFSQPYYSPHPLVHLRRGERRAFLHTYYTMFATLADFETYSFWEHYFHASPHKTHEEGWFLMQTRWMLWLESVDRLDLLPGVPAAWLAPGKTIDLKGARSYFGAFDLTVAVSGDGGRLEIEFAGSPERLPTDVAVRLEHPAGGDPRTISGGRYSSAERTLHLDVRDGHASATVEY